MYHDGEKTMDKALRDGWEKIQGSRLTECRKKKKYSRTQLGLKVSVSMETIKKYENGERSKGLNDPKTLTALSKALDVEKGYLSGDDNFQCDDYTEYLKYKALSNTEMIELSEYVIDAIADAVVKKMQEPKTGHWIEHYNPEATTCMQYMIECSSCGKMMCSRYNVYRNYCPNCGAKMESEEQDGRQNNTKAIIL